MTRVPPSLVRALLLLATAAGWLGALRLTEADPGMQQWVSNGGLLAVTGTAAACCLLRARAGGPASRAWRLLAAGAGSWGLGQLVWTVYECVQGREVPFPSAADAGYLLAVPLLAAGLLALPGSPSGASARLRLVLDGVLVAVSLAMLSWEVVLADVVAAGGDTPFATTISLLYPLGDVVCGTVALVALARARHGSPVPVPALLLLAAGTLAFAAGDTGFAYLTLHGAYHSGHPVDLGWFLGFGLLGLAARSGAAGSGQQGRRDQRGAHVGLVAPYAAVVLALGAAVVRELLHGSLGPLAWGALALVGLLVVRQVLTLLEVSRLTRGLEARVDERTRELAGQERWFRGLVQNLTDVVVVVDEDGVVTWVTPSCRAHVGLPPEALSGRSLHEWWAPVDAARLHPLLGQLRRSPERSQVFSGELQHADGRLVPVEATVTALTEGQGQRGCVLTLRDVTERRRLERELVHQAFHDTLTGLANRALLADRLGHALASCAADDGRALAVLLLDLDGFKAVNDTLGHGAGDRLLQQVAVRLQACVRPGDTVARLGGDEFAVLLEGLVPGEDGSVVARRIAAALRAPLVVEGREVQVRCSTGIATSTASATAEELLRNADLAMYRAKAAGAGAHAVYEPEMHLELVQRTQLEADLRRAVERGQLEVWYQPTYGLADGGAVGCEALLRWRHPERGLVAPLDFVPLAEETGLIVEIGAWVLREAVRQTAAWRAGTPELADLCIAVNVSSAQLVGDAFLELVDAALAEAGLPAEALTVELTESVLVEHDDAMRDLLGALSARGVRVAIDDFGTGYSSLAYLHRFPVDVLKVDRSFVSGVASGAGGEELTRTIVRLGQSLGLTIVAEGIEQADQLSSLRVMGCDQGQGFLFSRPLPAQDLVAALVPALVPTA